MKNRKRKNSRLTGEDYVKALLTGRFIKKAGIDGKIKEEFVPSIINKYPTLGDLEKSNSFLTKQQILAKEALTHFDLKINRGIFQKTKEEKKALKKAKKAHFALLRKHDIDPKKKMNIPTS